MTNLNKNKFLTTFFLIILLAVSAIFVATQVTKDRDYSVESTEALFGGEVEKGYPYAGYLVAYKEANKVNVCGSVYLKNNIAITAAHCIYPNASVYLGDGEFSYSTGDNFTSSSTQIFPSWDGKTNALDLAVVQLRDNTPDIFEFAQIATPKVGCDYKIVAYGRTEKDEELGSSVRLRKSADVCIEKVEKETFQIKSEKGGICFGDSGSPIFEKGTNKVVGVISAIKLDSESKDPCFIKNTAIVTRVDTKQQFIASVSDNKSLDSNIARCGESCGTKTCANGLTCDASKTCSLPAGGCSVEQGGFCSVAENISCSGNTSCVINSCVEIRKYGEGLDLENVFANLSVDFQNLNITQKVSLLGVLVLLISSLLYILIVKSSKK